MKILELAEQAKRTKTKEIKDAIAEQQELLRQMEARQLAISHEAQKVRSEKESRYWALVQKLHKEKDNNSRLDKRIKAKNQQIEDLKAKNEKEISSLQVKYLQFIS